MGDLGNHTVTVIQPPAEDQYGDPLPGSGSEADVEGCYFQPGPSSEQTDQRDTVTSLPVLFAPPGAGIRPNSRIRFRGVLYQIDGKPADWDDIDATPHHLEVALRRVEG